MKKTLQDQYLLIKEGKGHKDIFIKEAKRQFPGLIRNAATYTEVANVLKTKNLINENVVGLEPINQLQPSKKEPFEVAFENFIAEAKQAKEDDEKAELKKPSKQVEEDAEKNFDYKDKKNPDNLIFDQMMKGYYTEMKDPKNEDKTMEQLKAIVIKNLEKNPIYYTEKGQFGVKDLGYTMDAPGLGEPKEPKGKYKSSGYGNLKENKEPVNEETQIRKVVRSIINEELEEGYDDGEMGTYQSTNTKHYKDPQDMETYLNAIKGMKKVEAIEHLGEEGLSSSMVMRVLNKADRMGMFDVQDMFDVNPRVRGDVFEDKEDDGFDEVWEKFKKDLRKRMGQPESPKNESLKESDDFNSRLDDVINNQYDGDPKVKEAAIDWNALQNVKMGSGREAYAPMLNRYWQDYGRETGNTGVMAAEEAGGFGFTTMYESKIRKVIRESVEKELQEINKLAEYEVFESKLEKIAELIEKKSARLNRLDEDEDLKALTDKKKVKELQKDIKKLEKAKAKIEKALAKKAKSTPKKKEVIDEDEPLDEGEAQDALDASEEKLDAVSGKADELIAKLEEDDVEGMELTDFDQQKIEKLADKAEKMFERLTGRDNAGGNMTDEDALENVLSEFPAYMDKEIKFVEQHLMSKFDLGAA